VAASNAPSNPANPPGAPEFILSREFDAPREKVFAAFTTLDALKQWWGPRGFQWISATLDMRPGGMFHYCMRSPQGADMWGRFVYREVVPPERIVFVNSFSDPSGGITANPWMPEWPREVLNIVTFSERDGKTTVSMRGSPIHASEASLRVFEGGRESMQKGFAGTFAQLEEYLGTQGPERAS
jgi:uncharacterized protein YndB with AHSA1/START domain